jgi:membrane protease YdiL (CAAX protease family)
LPPPTGAPAGWYRDPYGYPVVRYYDGRQWTAHTAAVLEPARQREAHPALPLQVAVGAVAVLVGSLLASRYLLEYLVRFDWPIVVYAVFATAVGYGPSVWWCAFASRRWGTGRLVADVGLRFRWSDAGWGPLAWLAALGCEIAVLIVVELVGIPLVGNTEGLGELDLDRTYVISLLITAVVAAPFVEEMVFRGLILRGLNSRLGAVAAVGVQAGVFGLAHVDPVRGRGNIGLVLVLAAVGVAFGGAAYLLRRIGPTIIAHAIFNGIVMAIVLTR